MSLNNIPTHDDALAVIRSLGQQCVLLKLTKQFKGIVLNQDVRIIAVDQDSVIIQATKHEMCAIMEGYINLRHQDFPNPMEAQLKVLNMAKGMFVLSRIGYINTEWKERQMERVQPKSPTYISLCLEGKEIRTPLENISVNGMRVMAYKASDKGINFQPGTKIDMMLPIPPRSNWMTLKGNIVYSRPIDKILEILGIEFRPNTRQAQSLEKYISLRKKEILEEVYQVYIQSFKTRGIESLFF
jgi:hypothetical protein